MNLVKGSICPGPDCPVTCPAVSMSLGIRLCAGWLVARAFCEWCPPGSGVMFDLLLVFFFWIVCMLSSASRSCPFSYTAIHGSDGIVHTNPGLSMLKFEA